MSSPTPTDATSLSSQGPDRPQGRIALALCGGGARSAYQVGVLLAISRMYPDFRFPILTGVSAGAINISLLASHVGTLREQMDRLVELWRGLRLDNVFVSEGISLLCRLMRVGAQLTIGNPFGIGKVYGMVDTSPLRAFLLAAAMGHFQGFSKTLTLAISRRWP